MRHLGILWHSAEDAALCFRTFCHEGAGALGPHTHPDVTLDCIAFGPCMPAYERGDHRAVRDVVAVGVARLAAAGADFFACPDNTVPPGAEEPGPDLALPGLHIAQVVADRDAGEGRRRVGVLGTASTMDGPVYLQALSRHGIRAEVPEAADRDTVDRASSPSWSTAWSPTPPGGTCRKWSGGWPLAVVTRSRWPVPSSRCC